MVNKEILLENFKITGIENVDDEILQKCEFISYNK